MKDYIKFIEKKLKDNFKLEQLKIVNNTHKHLKHKFYKPGKYHLLLEIESKYLNSMSKLTAHKEIMRVLREEINNKIHALEIKIK